ncbi:transporter substrate-binding domain-containing protein [Fundidesulfovibrio agrisoli]|uniref:transporter substrate-binding domain-containing protein n=1 Tax=Fundidesulfovibrio agrisoli TaxID=2922717 RepID=UPI001FAC28FC|nr:transporter substrate-binding domain-containing protein [Fundidesulfovibrio agrisoli]
MTRVLALALAALTLLAAPAAAGDTFEMIKKRGELRCGVSNALPGLSQPGADGVWRGLEIDFSRAVAAAVLGDPAKVSFLPLETAGRFPALLAKQVDLLGRNTSWTIGREAQLKVSFAGPLLYTAQRFMVRTADGIRDAKGLDGASLCIVKGTTHAQDLEDFSAANGIRMTPLYCNSAEQARDVFLAGQCKALTADGVVLAGFLSSLGPGAAEYAVLRDANNYEIIAPVVRSDDAEWLLAVRSVLAALVHAEECGLTRDGAAKALADGGQSLGDGAARRTLGDADAIAKALGLAPGWMLRAVAASGNYGEMFESNLGSASPLRLDRGRNRLWSDGGLMYAPPF